MKTYLLHFGILGQKWGVRRFQNKDGTLTPKGRTHYEKREKQLKDHILRETNDVQYLRETWKQEGWGKKDIDLGVEEFELGIKDSKTELSKIQKMLNQPPPTKAQVSKLQERIDSSRKEGIEAANKKKAAIQKDIDSFKPFIKTGIVDNKGRLMLSPEDVSKSIEALQKVKDKL